MLAVELPLPEVVDELEAMVEVVDDFAEVWLAEDFAVPLPFEDVDAGAFFATVVELAGGVSAAAVVAVSPSFL